MTHGSTARARSTHRQAGALGCASLTLALLLAGCAVEVQVPRVYVPPPPQAQVVLPAPQAVVSVYEEPPLEQPEPIGVPWAPPPMLVEPPPPMPYPDAVWVGGYWVWEGSWVWAAGRWTAPPRPAYHWVHPYYEHRDGLVVFITGHWCAPGVVFVPPAIDVHIHVVVAAAGVAPGLAPVGPQGVFVPPPPGSRPGLIVPAPLGTAPAVVVSAPPVVNVGMRIQNNISNGQVTNVTVNKITNITNVTIVAPPGAMASGHGFQSAVPAQPHLAAALPPVVHAQAPVPVSAAPLPSFRPDRAPQRLPPPQTVQTAPAPGGSHPAPGAYPAPAAPVAAHPAYPAQHPGAQGGAAPDLRPAYPGVNNEAAQRAAAQARAADEARAKAAADANAARAAQERADAERAAQAKREEAQRAQQQAQQQAQQAAQRAEAARAQRERAEKEQKPERREGKSEKNEKEKNEQK